MEWHSIVYSVDDIILCGFQEDDLPLFGKVFDINIVGRENTFSMRVIILYERDNCHFYSYVLQPIDSKALVPMNN